MIRAVAAGCVTVMLVGCVTQSGMHPPPDLLARRDALQSLQDWGLEGRMSVRYEQKGFSGAVNWRQQQEEIDARFHGPLGAGAFNLRGTAEELVVETGDGQVYHYQDPEAMLRAQFGWTIPVAEMPHWLLGLPAPGSPATEELDPDGHLARLSQRGWTVTYDRYTPVGNWDMPKRIELSGTDVTVRLAIHSWNLDSN